MDGAKSLKRQRRLLPALVLALGLLSVAREGCAEVITFPEEDLAAESVLPVFDNPVSVKNKAIVTTHRFEFGLLGGLSLAEPFYNPLSYGLNASYHFTDEHAFTVTALMFLQGLSSNANNLNPIPNSKGPTGAPNYANLQYGPAPKYFILANYQYTGFYGKISLSKETILRLHLYGLAGIDALGVGNGLDPGAEIGIGQKLYFTPNFALRTDFHLIAYEGPNVLSRSLANTTSVQSASSFTTTTLLVSLLSVGVSYLF